MTNERDSVRVAHKAILLLLYTWNSCPIPGTDISRSLVAVGREFTFPIDYSTNKHWELTSFPSAVESYSRDLATRLSALRDVAHLLMMEQRAYHKELINSRWPDPHVFSVGDMVFARRSVHSDSSNVKSTNSSMPTLVHGASQRSSKMHHTNLNIVLPLIARIRSMLPTSPHTRLS
jgi:hypothetical protein